MLAAANGWRRSRFVDQTPNLVAKARPAWIFWPCDWLLAEGGRSRDARRSSSTALTLTPLPVRISVDHAPRRSNPGEKMSLRHSFIPHKVVLCSHSPYLARIAINRSAPS